MKLQKNVFYNKLYNCILEIFFKILCLNLAIICIIFAPKFFIPMPNYSTLYNSFPIPIAHFGVSQGFKNPIKSPAGTALYIRARRKLLKIPIKSILAFQEGLFTLRRQLKKNIHI